MPLLRVTQLISQELGIGEWGGMVLCSQIISFRSEGHQLLLGPDFGCHPSPLFGAHSDL